MLVIAMIVGAGAYLLYCAIPALHPAGPAIVKAVTKIQPVLLFMMLFLSFCRIEPKELKPHRWQVWLLLIQGGVYTVLALLIAAFPEIPHRFGIEAFMLCMICPTATAAAVVTGKLGGDMAGVITYTVFINLLVALLVPAFVPLIYPVGGISFTTAFLKILGKVFPLLIMPCLLAWFIRYFIPKLHRLLLSSPELPFRIWAVSLTLAILMSTRAIVHGNCGLGTFADIAVASVIACALQFYSGKRIGARYSHEITAGQALGQKNTVFAIWMGYTFMDPIVSVAGGFYSIWHNVFNTWQLRRHANEKDGRSE